MESKDSYYKKQESNEINELKTQYENKIIELIEKEQKLIGK